MFCTLHDVALMLDRGRKVRDQSLDSGRRDSQLIKAPVSRKRGFYALPSLAIAALKRLTVH